MKGPRRFPSVRGEGGPAHPQQRSASFRAFANLHASSIHVLPLAEPDIAERRNADSHPDSVTTGFESSRIDPAAKHSIPGRSLRYDLPRTMLLASLALSKWP